MRHHRSGPDSSPRPGDTSSPPTGADVDELTRLALRAAHDRAAAERFVALTAVDTWRLCAHLVDAAAADDLTQETYERALKALGGFRAESSARTWLLVIARRVCADEIRDRTRRRRGDAAVVAAFRTRADGDPAERQALDDLVRALPDERRDAFVLTQVVGLRYDEAAEVLDCAVGTIRSRVARARAELQALLGDAAPPPVGDPDAEPDETDVIGARAAVGGNFSHRRAD